MRSHVSSHAALLRESLVTMLALEWALSGVRSVMLSQMVLVLESLITMLAFERTLSRVGPHVPF